MTTQTMEKIAKDLDFIKKEIIEIKEHMVDVDSIMTDADLEALEEARRDFKAGKLKRLN